MTEQAKKKKSTPSGGIFKELTPQEIDKVKSQVAVLLNYTKQGGSVAPIPEDIKAKIKPETRERIVKEIERLLTPKAK